MAQKRRRTLRQVFLPRTEYRYPVRRAAILPAQRFEQIAVLPIARHPHGNDSALMVKFNVQSDVPPDKKCLYDIVDDKWENMLF